MPCTNGTLGGGLSAVSQLDKLMEASKYCEDTVPIAWSSRGVAQLSVELEAYAAVSVTFTREPSAKTDDGLARPAMTVTIQNTEARRDVNGTSALQVGARPRGPLMPDSLIAWRHANMRIARSCCYLRS